LNGKGNFPKDENTNQPIIPVFKDQFQETKREKQELDLFSDENTIEKNPVFENATINFSNTGNMSTPKNDSEIERIVIFYKNGSFKNYVSE
jgi:ADP-dependent phosphofructokinase/glucokinase